MEKIRLALAGAWHVHTAVYLPSIRDTFGDRVEWRYVWDEDDARALRFCEELSCPRASSLQEIMNDPAVDAVICEAETCRHREIITRAAEAGKPVYTDKALATRVEDALAIKRAVDAAGVKFAVSHEVIPVPAYQYVKRLIDGGMLGDVVSMHFRRAHGGAKPVKAADGKPRSGLPADWFSREIAGGGALIDLGIHGVALLQYLCGKPRRVSAFLHNFTGHETEDSATILVEFENGAIGTAHTDMVTSYMDNNLELLGTEGSVVVSGFEGDEVFRLTSNRMKGFEHRMTPVDPSGYAAGKAVWPVCAFIAFVMDESDPRQYLDGLDVDTGVAVVQLVEAAYESARTGRVVEIQTRD